MVKLQKFENYEHSKYIEKLLQDESKLQSPIKKANIDSLRFLSSENFFTQQVKLYKLTNK